MMLLIIVLDFFHRVQTEVEIPELNMQPLLLEERQLQDLQLI